MPRTIGRLEALVHENHYDLMGTAESWLYSSHEWAGNIPGYAHFWRERIKQKGGDIWLYARSDLKISMKEDLIVEKCDGSEALLVELHVSVHTASVTGPRSVNEEVEIQLF